MESLTQMTTMTEQERKEKAIREYNELYAKFKAEFDRGSEAITKWLEHQDEPEKAKHYKTILDEAETNYRGMRGCLLLRPRR